MIILGAEGFAQEKLQNIVIDNGLADSDIQCFGDSCRDLPEKLFKRNNNLRSLNEVKKYLFECEYKSFVLGPCNSKY